MTEKTLDFRYCNYCHYILANVIFISMLFGLFLLCLYFARNIVLPIIGLTLLLAGWIATCFCAFLFAAGITDKKGTAIFEGSEVKFVFGEKTVYIAYGKIISLAYKKTIRSTDGWSFLPASKLIIATSGKRLCIHSSRKEAWEKKKEYGIRKTRKGTKPPDVSLWYICDELNRKTGKQIHLEEVIERTD